jgi:peptide/nickel transport system substrate-binding protein
VHFFYNFRSKGPLANPKVREALTYAIDGDKILETILLGSASALKGPIPDTLFGAADVGTFSYDPDKAKSMLADAGVPEGFEILMLWGTGEFFSATQIMETVREMLGAVGVNATLKEFQPGAEALATQYGSGELDWDVYANGIGNNTGDAFDTLIYLFAPTADLIASNRTYRGFNVPEITNLINTAATEPDLSKRLTLLTEAQEAIWGTWPMMWGFTQNVVLAHRKRVSGIEVRPIDFFDLSKVTVS